MVSNNIGRPQIRNLPIWKYSKYSNFQFEALKYILVVTLEYTLVVISKIMLRALSSRPPQTVIFLLTSEQVENILKLKNASNIVWYHLKKPCPGYVTYTLYTQEHVGRCHKTYLRYYFGFFLYRKWNWVLLFTLFW